MKEAKGGNPNSSQTLSLADLNSKDTEEEWKVQQCKVARLLDRNFGMWHDHMISEGHTEWNKHDTMICDHADSCKEAKFPDPTGPPLDYMKYCRVFKCKKTNEYDLCRFYQVGLSGDLPNLPSPHEPATHKLLSKFLLKARVLGHPNLVVAFTWDSFARTSHQRQPQAPANGAQGGCWQEGYQEAVLLPTLYVFKQQRHLIHKPHHVCGHYHANYWCGQYLNEVFTTGQQLKVHLKFCVGLPKEAGDCTPTSPEKEHMSKDPSSDSWPPPLQSSQESSQASLCQSQHSQKKKKSASTPKKADSATKSSKEESSKKVNKKSSLDKHHNKKTPKKEKHCDKDKVDKGKSGKSIKQ